MPHSTAARQIDYLRPFMQQAWQQMGNNSGPYEIRLTGIGRWNSRDAYNVIGFEAQKITLAPHRLFAVVGAGMAFSNRRCRYGEANPFQDIFDRDITELEQKVNTIRREFGRGWGCVSALHFLTDLGMACKPDIHLCKTIFYLGLAGKPDGRVNCQEALRINHTVMELAHGAEGELSPFTMRYTDKILMEISRQRLIP